jgi:hypothetical protein
LYAAFVWARGALNHQKRRLPARAVKKEDVHKIARDYPILMDRITELADKRLKGENTRLNNVLDETAKSLGVGPALGRGGPFCNTLYIPSSVLYINERGCVKMTSPPTARWSRTRKRCGR